MIEVVPDQFRAAILLGAGEGMRLGEVLGIENSARCVDTMHGEIHVVQQPRFHKVAYGGFYLAPPKAGSVRDVDLDDEVAAALAQHVHDYPPRLVELVDITAGTPDPGKEPRRRTVALLFTDTNGRPIHDQRWSDMWQQWRKAAGWPDEGTFHSLRHYYAIDYGGSRPHRCPEGATPLQPADHAGDLRSLVAQEGASPRCRRERLTESCQGRGSARNRSRIRAELYRICT
jgi:integrase